MTFDYADTAELAREALVEFGAPVVRRASKQGSYDPSSGSVANTTSETTRTGALFDYGAGQSNVRGNLVQAKDKRLLLDATDVVALSDVFVVGGVSYSVVSVGEVNPAGTPVLYDLHIRS